MNSTTLDAALAYWAADAGCAEIDLGSTTHFVWVWVCCGAYGAVAIAVVLLPLWWFRKRLDEDDCEDDCEDIVEDTGESSAAKCADQVVAGDSSSAEPLPPLPRSHSQVAVGDSSSTEPLPRRPRSHSQASDDHPAVMIRAAAPEPLSKAKTWNDAQGTVVATTTPGSRSSRTPLSKASTMKQQRSFRMTRSFSRRSSRPLEPEDSQRTTRGRSSMTKRLLGRSMTWIPGPQLPAHDAEPDLKAALDHLRKTSATDYDNEWRPVWGTRLEELQMIGGIGTMLYFRLLQILGICFAIMSTVNLPLALFSAMGSFAPDNGQVMTKTTIGNLAMLPKSGLAPDQRYVILGCQGIPLTRLTAIFSWLDFSAVVLFLVAIIFFRFYLVPKTIAADDTSNVTPRDFAVEINGLPPIIERQSEYKDLLSAHLVSRIEKVREQGFVVNKAAHFAAPDFECEKLPPPQVCELVLVRDYDGRLGSLGHRAKLLKKKEIEAYKQEDKAVEKLDKQIGKLTKRLGEAMKPEHELPVVRAYAILSTTLDKRCLIYDYRFAAYQPLRCCFPQEKCFHGSMLLVKAAPEPTDVFWENQDLGWKEHALRQGFAWLVFVVLIVVSLTLVYGASTGARQVATTSKNYLGAATCDPVGDGTAEALQASKCLAWNASTWTLNYALGEGGATLECFCSSKGYAAIVQDSQLTSACMSWLTNSARSVAIMGAATCSVVVINVVVQAILCFMAEFERPTSMSALSSSMMVKVAVAQCINTIVVVTLVNYYGPPELRAIADIVPFGQLLFRGDFDDVTRGWYTVVGGTICMNMLLNALTPGATSLALAALNYCWRRHATKNIKHQAELLELYTNPPFDISTRYAQLLTTVFCTLVYSSGLPILTFFAAAYMFVTYWCDKLVLLWASQRPPAYNAEMPRDASNAMLYAVGLHCIVAILMYSQPCTFPSNAVGGALASASAVGTQAANSGFVSWLSERVSRETTWIFFALLVVLLVLWALRTVLWIIGGTLGEALAVLVAACRRSSAKVADEGAHDGLTWAEAAEHIEMACPPASYSMDQRLEFKDLVKYLRDVEPVMNGIKVVPLNASEQPDANTDGQFAKQGTVETIMPGAVSEDS